MDTIEPLPKLDFTEALKDSPRFRQMIAIHECYFNRLEGRLNELIRLLTTMTEHGKHYVDTFYSLSILVNQLCAGSLPQDPATVATLKSLSDAYAHVVYLHRVLIENASANICSSINSFIKSELAKVSETRSQLESLSTSLDDALARKAAVPRARSAELADAKNALTAVGTCFAHTALDYVAQINITQAHKDHVILDAFWSFVKECNSFFSRGHAFFDEWTAVENGSISDTVAALTNKGKCVERKMQDRHSLVPKEVFLHPTGMSPEDDVVMEGYLFKRATNAFKTWHRRWFQIKDNRLLYSHRSADVETPTVMEADLKLCLVRQAPSSVERACCFELVTPTKSHLLQADSETLCTAWMRALQRTIHHLHENDESLPAHVRTLTSTNDETVNYNAPAQSKDTLLAELRRIPGNDKCADCGADSPKWASINLGVLLCIECCGIHRSFGVQVSKVRSLTMDSLEPEQRKLMLALGNRLVNSIYLAHLPNANIVPPPSRPTSSRPVREAWIKAKYVERRFAHLDIERARSSANVRAEGLRRNTAAKAISPTRSNSDRKLYEDGYAARSPSEPVAGSRLSPATPKNDWKSTPSIAADLRRVASCSSDSDIDGSQEVIGNSKCGARVLKAAALGDVAELCRLVAEGVDVHAPYAKTTALHTAIKNNQGMAAEFLMLNGSKVNALDASLNSPLHIACANALTLLVCQLMKRGADQRLRNCNGETALDLAIEGTHADIVTLLRLQEMRDEFTEEFNNPMDETVDDVMMDISRRMDPSLR